MLNILVTKQDNRMGGDVSIVKVVGIVSCGLKLIWTVNLALTDNDQLLDHLNVLSSFFSFSKSLTLEAEICQKLKYM